MLVFLLNFVNYHYICAKSLQWYLALCNAIDCGFVSMGFSRQEYWSGLPRLPPRDINNIFYQRLCIIYKINSKPFIK